LALAAFYVGYRGGGCLDPRVGAERLLGTIVAVAFVVIVVILVIYARLSRA
jgi:membrane protein DedA with SNARE-associated domain